MSLLALLLYHRPAIAQPSPADTIIVHLKYLADGQSAWVEPVVTGRVDLYRRPDWIRQTPDPSRRGRQPAFQLGYQYLIGRDTLAVVDLYNYKKMVRRLLPEAAYLHRKLGRQGFRFENLPQMLTYYNRENVLEPTRPVPAWRAVQPLVLPR